MIFLLVFILQEGHSVHGEAFNEGPRQRAVRMAGMGDLRFPVTTTREDAQAFVNQGVGQLHGFYYFEAERSFRQAAALDPDCAIAYWGMAVANINNEKRAKGFIAEALKRKDKASPRERRWIETFNKHFTEKDKAAKAKALVKGLEEIVVEFPDDLEAKAFLAWSCWHVKDKGLPIQSHVAVDGLLKDVLAERPSHPGAHHYTIHLWDQEKAARALDSAASYGPSSPGIAHAWHMPGHIYSKLQRYADAAWHQEASSRVDHAQMRRDGTMPWQIHNYAHNQQWCAKSLGLVGRVRDGLALAGNLIEIPKHPKLNHDGGSGQCFREGRARTMDLLSAWELWDELLARADGALAPIDNRDDTVQRGRAVGAALVEKGRLDDARAMLQSLEALKSKPEKEEEKKDEPYKEEEPKPDDKKKDEKKKDDKKGKALEAAIHELRGRIALAEGDAKKAVEPLEKAELPKATLALLLLRAGEKEKAEKAAKEAVAAGKGELLPLAVRAEIDGKHPPELAATGRFADADLPILRRIGFAPPSPRPLPEAGTRGTSLDDLGPLLWSPRPAPPLPLTIDRPTLAIFYLGSGCAHCRQQLEAFSKADLAGLQVVAISTETDEQVAKAREEKRVVVPFAMRADPEKGLFKAFRCWDDFEDMPLHGTFLLDAEGRIRWQEISYTPFMEAEFLVKEARRLLGIKQ